MTKIKLTNNKFLGVQGYEHVEFVTIIDVIARDVVPLGMVEDVEFAIANGMAFRFDNFTMEAA